MKGVHSHGRDIWLGGGILYGVLVLASVLIKWLGNPEADETADLDAETTPKFGLATETNDDL